MEFTEIIAIATSSFGIFLAIFTFWRKKKVEDKLKIILQNKREIIEKELLELSKVHLQEKIRNNFEYKKQFNDLIIKVYEKELDNIREKFKYDLLIELNQQEKRILEENLEQKYLSGKVDYLNKLIHMSGSTKSIELEKE